MGENSKILDNYLAKLNLEGDRGVWRQNRKKIDYIYGKSKKFLRSERGVAEIGLGEGYLVDKLVADGFSVTGFDISDVIIKHLQAKYIENNQVDFVEGDFTELNEGRKFQAVYCLDVLEHIKNINEAIEKVKAMLESGGLIIGTLPFGENLSKNMVKCPNCAHEFHKIGHYHSFQSVQTIESLLQGFKLLSISKLPSQNRSIMTVLREASIALRLRPQPKPFTIYFIAQKVS